MSKIFIDLDGTILDVRRKCYRLYVNPLSFAGFYTMDMDTYWQMKRDRIPEEEIAIKTTTKTFAKYYVKKRRALLETSDYLSLDTVFDGAYTVLDKWFSCYDLYLVTFRRNTNTLNEQLELLDLNKYFKHIYSLGNLKVKKKDLIEHEIHDKTDCVIIGDTDIDVETGNSLSIKTVAVTSGLYKKSLLQKMSTDIVCKNICDPKLSVWLKNNLCRG